MTAGGEVLPVCAMPINKVSAIVSLSVNDVFLKVCRNEEPVALLTVRDNSLRVDKNLKSLSFP